MENWPGRKSNVPGFPPASSRTSVTALGVSLRTSVTRTSRRGWAAPPPSAECRDVLARHPDVHVRDLDTAAELIVFTVELNTHKVMADPRTIPAGTLENELVDMVTRYLRGER
nr:hypothetical protein [Streptomyces sp. AmelKG-A3]